MNPVRVITGKGVPLVRTDVDTDQIIPSDWLKRVERTGFGEGLFSEWRENSDFVLNQERYDGAKILVAGPNFGTGSSREHAVWALSDFGFEAVIAPSYADIFYVNCTKNGLLPVILAEEACRGVAEAGEARIDVDEQSVDFAGGVVRFEIDAEIKHRLLHGLDDIGITLQRADEIDSFQRAGGADRGPVTTAL